MLLAIRFGAKTLSKGRDLKTEEEEWMNGKKNWGLKKFRLNGLTFFLENSKYPQLSKLANVKETIDYKTHLAPWFL